MFPGPRHLHSQTPSMPSSGPGLEPIVSSQTCESPLEDSSTRIGSESTIPPHPPILSKPSTALAHDHESLRVQLDRPGAPLFKSLTDPRPRPGGPQKPSRSLLFRRARGYTTQPKGYLDYGPSDSSSSSDSDSDSGADARKYPHHMADGAKKHRPATQRQGSRRKSLGPARVIADPMANYSLQNQHYSSKAKVKNGRLEFSVKALGDTDYLQNAIDSTIASKIRSGKPAESISEEEPAPENITPRPSADSEPVPKLNIVVMVIGSRGDVQPFLQIGKVLKAYGHRVRLATHPAFKEFVENDSGLEFFSVGGDPAELMAFMVKNPGLVPSMSSIKAGDVGKRRESMYEMMEGFFRACINVSDENDDEENRRMMKDSHPFVADAIIANPPSFAHIHCAERLGIPLHIMFTMPFTPTQDYPHPLSRINAKKSNVDKGLMNWMSYPYVELMTWQGLGDLVNKFRTRVLGLEPMSTLWAPGQLFRLGVPYTYLWSPALAPKPKDWGPEINVTGYVFLDLASTFTPPSSLTKFLESGDKPVYIGFGSITIDDPDTFTSLIFEAVAKSGVRALVSEGWGGLGGPKRVIPDNIYMLDNTPHDWLFPRVSAVVHHGGAGTTAIGLKCGIPTMIVHFFGDQPFWGSVVTRAGAGARKSIPWKKLTADKLADGITECMSVEARAAATKLAECIAAEGDGAANAVSSFHAALPLSLSKTADHSMRCDVHPSRVAVWTTKPRTRRKDTPKHLSALAATELLQARVLRKQDLRLVHHMDWNDFQGPGEPFTGGTAAIIYSAGSAVKGIASIPHRIHKSIKKDKSDPELKAKKRHPRSANTLQAVTRSTTRGLVRSASVLCKAPLDISLAITLGFHNAPRLYGDSTVPPPPAMHRIRGYKSGWNAGLVELKYGFVEGYAGLVKLPILGAKEGKSVVTGAVKGVAKGIGGFVLKPIAGVLGVPAFSGMGLRREVRKFCSEGWDGGEQWIREARTLQGRRDREDVLRRKEVKAKREGRALGEREMVELERMVEERERNDEGVEGVEGVEDTGRELAKAGRGEGNV